MSYRLAALFALFARADAHGVLSDPIPREGAQQGADPADQGIKLQPFGDARRVANEGCGGTLNGGLANTVKQPTVAYVAGNPLLVTWKVTIPHDIDRLDKGVRIAVHYGAGDSFEQNVLVGCVEGDGNCFQDENPQDGVKDNAVDAGTGGAGGGPNNDEFSQLVTLPPGKTAAYAVIQWMWSARADGGFYISCADVAITEDGLLPDYLAIPSEVGKELPGGSALDGGVIPPSVSVTFTATEQISNDLLKQQAIQQAFATEAGVPTGSVQVTVQGTSRVTVKTLVIDDAAKATLESSLRAKFGTAADANNFFTTANPPVIGVTVLDDPIITGEGGGGGDVGTVIGIIIAVIVVIIIVVVVICVCKNRSGGGGGGKPPPPTLAGGGGGLPPGWSSAVDPASGRTYYVNANTGETSWEMPGGAPPGPPPGGGLPAGWTQAVDPASGRTYYVNSTTGATSWEMPR